MSGRRAVALLTAGLVSAAPVVFAGGPLIIFDPATRTPYAYPVGNVNVYTDLGTNGILTNAQSDVLVANAFTQWTAVPSAYFSAVIAGEIKVGGVPTDITLANVDSIISTDVHDAPNGGGIFVIYDTDGSIVSGFFGAPPGVAGIASPEFADTGTPNLTESWVVLNGSLIDPGDTSPIPGATFGGIYTHEIGHSINLAHTQTNGAIIFPFGDNDGPNGCLSLGGIPDLSQMETMYPFIDNAPGSTGLYQATVDQLDDIAALSDIYPTGGWPGTRGTITGKITMPDGTTEVSGVNVVARNLADPLGNCVSAISGDHTQGALGPDGRFTLHGLTPGAPYAVYVDKLMNGGFSTPATSVMFLEEYWNGAGESGNVATDTTCAYVPISVGAGGTATANILLNVLAGTLALADDDAANVPLPFSFWFCGTAYQSVWVNSNGNVTFGTGDTNPNASATGLLVGAPRICGLWDDLDPASGGVVAAAAEGGNFVVRFFQVPDVFAVYFGGGTNTFTITLRPNGTHRVDYGETFTILSTLAGRSPGGGAVNPGATDLSVAAQPLGQSVDTVYEEFFFGDDLTGLSLEYAPCGTQVAVPEDGVTAGAAALLQSRPNPFRAGTVISFDLPQPGPVRLRVFDIRGRLVTTIADEKLDAGRYSFPWSGKDAGGREVAPGIYFYRLETPTFQATRKAIRAQ